MCKALSSLGSGQVPGRSPRHLPASGHNLLTETEVKVSVAAEVEGWAFAKPILAQEKARKSQNEHTSAWPAA